MGNWFRKLNYKLSYMMRGRHGVDELSRFLSVFSLILLVASLFKPLRWLYIAGLVLIVLSWFRSFSKNIYRRQKERVAYLRITGKIRQWFTLRKNIWKNRKTHKYYKCPYCKGMIRITKPPKGKEITVTCSKCRKRFDKKT